MPLIARIIFSGLGLIAVCLGIRIFQQNQRTQKWHTTKAEVLESSVTGFDDDFITIEYKYTVRGIEYVGDRFNVGGGSVGNALELIKQYKPGAIVKVIYNPRNPSESALVRDSVIIPLFMITVGIIFILFGLFVSF